MKALPGGTFPDFGWLLVEVLPGICPFDDGSSSSTM